MKTLFTVFAVATDGNGKYLVLQRADHRTDPNTWNFVTGYVKDRESAEDAALRELEEETNLRGKIAKTSEPFWSDMGEKRYVVVASLIKVENLDDLKIDKNESKNFRWIAATDELVDEFSHIKDGLQKLGEL